MNTFKSKAILFIFCSIYYLVGCAHNSNSLSPNNSRHFDFPIIDAHIHTAFPEMTPPKDVHLDLPRQSLAQLTSEMAENGVKMAISHAVGDGKKGPGFYQDLRDKGITHCYGIYNQWNIQKMRPLFESGQFRCIKIYLGYTYRYASDALYTPLYELAEEFDVPVIFHTGDTFDMKGKLKYADPLTIDEVAVDHPGVRFVIAHCGNPWIESAAEVAYKNPNVYLDGSALLVGNMNDIPPEKVKALVIKPLAWIFAYLENPSKLMYGSDWPLTKMGPYIEAFKQAIPSQHWKDVFYLNAQKVFKLDDSQDY